MKLQLRRLFALFPTGVVFKTIEGLDMPLAHAKSDMPIWGALFVRQAPA